jgi:hypothetical protein
VGDVEGVWRIWCEAGEHWLSGRTGLTSASTLVEVGSGCDSLHASGECYTATSESRTKTRTNLMVFLRPVVLRDAAAGERLTLDRYDIIRARQEAAQPAPSPVLPGGPGAVLPPLRPPGAPGGTLPAPAAPRP